jgi:predicted XRE-type DNA-binding protein
LADQPNAGSRAETDGDRLSAANSTARGMLMIAIEQRIKESGWTQAEAAKRFHVTQPRVSDLLNAKINKFSLDALVDMLPAPELPRIPALQQQTARARGASCRTTRRTRCHVERSEGG